jgi:hypothetical protein
MGMLVGAHSHEGGTRAQRQVLGFIHLLIFGGKCFTVLFRPNVHGVSPVT